MHRKLGSDNFCPNKMLLHWFKHWSLFIFFCLWQQSDHLKNTVSFPFMLGSCQIFSIVCKPLNDQQQRAYSVACLTAPYPLSNIKRMFCWVQRYSTVGVRVPIWRLRMLLKIWATSFLPCWLEVNSSSYRKYNNLSLTTHFQTKGQIESLKT